MKSQKRASSRPKSAGSIRRVYEVYSGLDLEFDGAIVVEVVGPVERILFWAQSKGHVSPYDSDAEREEDRQMMVRLAESVAGNQAVYKSARKFFIDLRRFGLPNSKERMPDFVYAWVAWAPGDYLKGSGRHLFPYCPFRMDQMASHRDALVTGYKTLKASRA